MSQVEVFLEVNPNPVLEMPVPGFFAMPSAPQTKGPCIFYETLSLQKTITSLYFSYEMV
ncbi:hypothetical protein [Paenibacillus dendritiformis]|uniref:hypothetical protein n=1 Tax=Paenibacillus dendritiformis TaxID=130049 RepID=UPI0020C5374B|nr:hypothetical protein [Paenibacillus dendritiformis]CAH8768837.1 hypothetical protein H7S4_001535 [Paenibacillus dendritiformis]